MSSRLPKAGTSSRRSERGPVRAEFALGFVLFSVWALGQLFRDRTLASAWAFYLPSVVVAATIFLLSGYATLRRRRRAALALALLALLPAVAVVAVENRWRSLPARKLATDLRVVAWNVADFPRGIERAAALLRPLDADLILLSEAPGRPPRELERLLGGRLRLTPAGAMALYARNAPLEIEWLAREPSLQVAIARWPVEGRSLGILAVNVISSPLVARDPLLDRVLGMIREHQPDIVLGDFNAPRRSRALAALPPGFHHAYDVAGSGWSATWPAALPLLAIDQTIVGPQLEVRGYELRTTSISDHRLQIADLDFGVFPPGGSG